jgi:two-component system CheB/CheR fusion protein
VVIAQHLDPNRQSHLAPILSRHTALPVRSVESHERLSPGTIYVVPANRHVSITDHEVHVHADQNLRPSPSIDLLLATAASVFGERLVAVILTGSGSDGAEGAHAVKEAGGTIVIQDPATAAFPSMPRALAPPLVDAVVPLEGIGPFLTELVSIAMRLQPTAEEPGIPDLLTRLRDFRGIDFSAYKPPTIERRLRWRMAAAGAQTIGAYLAYLDSHPEEEQRLIADFLIKVTRFFRDPVLFSRLRDEILPELVDVAESIDRELRLWSAGCATGEEAYSLALIVADLTAAKRRPIPVRIFATDLDDMALAFARRGVYPTSALADVPPDIVERHFAFHDGTYEVGKEVRSLIVFGSHDLAQRPPFPQTDLVLCRNVLNYFTPELQRRALGIFAYSLRDDGYLVLGKSETPRPADPSFRAFDSRLRIYRRQGPRPSMPPARLPLSPDVAAGLGLANRISMLGGSKRPSVGTDQITESAKSITVEDLTWILPVGVAVVNREYDVESINGAARELLGIHGLALEQDLIHLAQGAETAPLRQAIDAVARGEGVQRVQISPQLRRPRGKRVFFRSRVIRIEFSPTAWLRASLCWWRMLRRLWLWIDDGRSPKLEQTG